MAKKRANGEGNIRKRKDGRWEGRYTAGYDETTSVPPAGDARGWRADGSGPASAARPNRCIRRR